MNERVTGANFGVVLTYWEGKTVFVDGGHLVSAAQGVCRTGEPYKFLFSRDSRDDDEVAANLVQEFFDGMPCFISRIQVVPDEENLGYLRIEKRAR